MKTKMQLSPKVAPNIKLSARMIYVVGGIIIATLIGIFLFIYLNLGNPFRSVAADITFTTVGSGNWATNATWQGGASPGGTLNSNDVTIKSSHTVTRTGNVTGESNVIFTIEANGSLTINGDLIIKNDFILNNSGTLIITGSLILKNNAAVTINGGGTLTVGNNITAENNTSFTVNGSLNVSGNVTFGNNPVFTGSGSVNIAGNGCGNWTGSTPCQNGATILPVKLLAFKASDEEDGTVKITWSTAQEKNNDYFTIQRSGDGLTYIDLKTIKGNGTTENVSHYDMVDTDPGSERLYYRLAQTDFDGVTEIFEPVFVQVKLKTGQLSAYPNPMTGRNLTVHLPKAEAGTIQFLDNGGKIILNKESDGSSNLIELDFADDLLQGLYYIKYKSRSGVVQSLKIVKK